MPRTIQFGKYILFEKIASGGMAEIFLAKNQGAENVSKFIAIKRILPEFSQNQEFIQMFKEEAKIAIHLSHSNVVSIFEFSEERGQFYLSMEFVQGHNLRKILNRITKLQQFLSVDQIVYIVNEVSRGLGYAHRCVSGTTGKPLNIIHRDMSPQNIMINYEGEIKIVDFGIAKAESKIENTRAGTLKGKFGYMSPEQVDGLEVDARSDIFSLGIVLWELLSGKRLFISNNEVNTLRKIRDCHIPSLQPLNPNIPAELERITNKALARDRSLRYQSADDFHRDLNRFLHRQYPDFTVHDFSRFIKTLFAKEREDIRRKLVNYGKVQLPLTKETTTFAKEGTHTLSAEPSKTQKKNPSNNKIEPLSIDDAHMGHNNLEVEMPKQQQKTENVAPHTAPHYQKRYEDSHFVTQSEYHTTETTDNKFITGVISLVFLALIALSGYYVWSSPDLRKKILNLALGTHHDNSFQQASQEKKIDVIPEPPPVANTISYLIRSIPSGAKIFIDDAEVQPTIFTPSEITIEANKAVKIKLQKRGYKPFVKNVRVSKDGEQLYAELVKTSLGYLNLNVQPSDADIYINKKKIPESPPLLEYPIPANKKIEIIARNNSRGTLDRKVIVIRENKLKTVNLFLTKPKIKKRAKKSKRGKVRSTSSARKKAK